MSGIETVEIIDRWIYGILSGDAQITAVVGDNVSGTLSENLLEPPYVTFLCQSTRDITGVGGVIIAVDTLYEVKAVAQSASWDDVLPLAKRINALLHRPNNSVTTTTGSLSSIRERVVQYPEVDEGLQYRHLGGLYRIRASSDV